MRKLKTELVEAVREGAARGWDASVAAAAEKVGEALKRGDADARVSAARASVFESANAPVERPAHPAMLKIVEVQMGDGEDPKFLVRDMRELEELLDSSNKVGQQVNALEQAEARARQAFRLFIRFKEMHAVWEMDNAAIFGALWAEATKTLQREKDQGYRSKQITDKDVDAMCATMFPDEFRSQEIRRLRAKSTEKSLEHLVEMWSSKCRSLTVLVGKNR